MMRVRVHIIPAVEKKDTERIECSRRLMKEKCCDRLRQPTGQCNRNWGLPLSCWKAASVGERNRTYPASTDGCEVSETTAKLLEKVIVMKKDDMRNVEHSLFCRCIRRGWRQLKGGNLEKCRGNLLQHYPLKCENGHRITNRTDMEEMCRECYTNLLHHVSALQHFKSMPPSSKLSSCWSVKCRTQPSEWEMEKFPATTVSTSNSSKPENTNSGRVLPSGSFGNWPRTSSSAAGRSRKLFCCTKRR